MNRLIKIVLVVSLFLMANTGFAKQTIHHSSTYSSIISSPANNLVSEKSPIPPATSLQAYRFRHGIDRGNVTVSRPIEIIVFYTPVIDIPENIAVSTDYFFSHTSLLPPPPDFLGCFSLRSPPFSC
jgi:hypothetical protein